MKLNLLAVATLAAIAVAAPSPNDAPLDGLLKRTDKCYKYKKEYYDCKKYENEYNKDYGYCKYVYTRANLSQGISTWKSSAGLDIRADCFTNLLRKEEYKYKKEYDDCKKKYGKWSSKCKGYKDDYEVSATICIRTFASDFASLLHCTC